MSLRLQAFSGMFALALTGCGGSDFSSVVASDAAVDTSQSDTAQDVAIESAPDAQTDSELDSSVDSGVDSGIDAAIDSPDALVDAPCTLETVVFQAIEDTQIAGPGTNSCADPGTICYGKGTFVHVSESATLRLRGLVKFQISVPLKKAQSAELKLVLQEKCDGVLPEAGELELRPLRTDWAEGTCLSSAKVDGATWQLASPTAGCWDAPGANGDKDVGVVVAKATVGPTVKFAKFALGPVDLAVLSTWKSSQNMVAFRVSAGAGRYCYGTREVQMAPTLSVTYCKE